ncbi:hypothetical protein BJX99DRAFT_32045 [Aspergillus californicus]
MTSLSLEPGPNYTHKSEQPKATIRIPIARLRLSSGVLGVITTSLPLLGSIFLDTTQWLGSSLAQYLLLQLHYCATKTLFQQHREGPNGLPRDLNVTL